MQAAEGGEVGHFGKYEPFAPSTSAKREDRPNLTPVGKHCSAGKDCKPKGTLQTPAKDWTGAR